MSLNILIIGGGISGLATALALHQHHLPHKISIYESRDQHSATILGGAVQLPPPAVRYLVRLGLSIADLRARAASIEAIEVFSCRTGARLGVLPCGGADTSTGPALRVRRGALLEALIVRATEVGIAINYGKRLTGIRHPPDHDHREYQPDSQYTRDSGRHDDLKYSSLKQNMCVSATFADQTTVHADLILGCDGIHSIVRSTFIDPARLPIYSGVAIAYGYAPASTAYSTIKSASVDPKLHFNTTSFNTARRGSLLLSFCDALRTTLYVSAVMQVAEEDISHDKEGEFGRRWKLQRQREMADEITERFAGGKIGCLETIIKSVDEWRLYPIYKLNPGGKWASSDGRVLLLGDAAHAMPPQGESILLALEDAILLAGCMSQHFRTENAHSLSTVALEYEKLRRPHVNAAHKEAEMRWENTKDVGWLGSILRDWGTAAFLWWWGPRKQKEWEQDVCGADVRPGA